MNPGGDLRKPRDYYGLAQPLPLSEGLTCFCVLLLFSAQRRRNESNRLRGETEPPTLSRTHRPARPAWGEEVSGVTQHHVSVTSHTPHPPPAEALQRSALTRVIMADSCRRLELMVNKDPGRGGPPWLLRTSARWSQTEQITDEHVLSDSGPCLEIIKFAPIFLISFVCSYLRSASCHHQ